MSDVTISYRSQRQSGDDTHAEEERVASGETLLESVLEAERVHDELAVVDEAVINDLCQCRYREAQAAARHARQRNAHWK